MTADRPNPGSDEARAQGCICAVLDNNHGQFAPWPPNGWWITSGCPVHEPKPATQKRQGEDVNIEDRILALAEKADPRKAEATDIDGAAYADALSLAVVAAMCRVIKALREAPEWEKFIAAGLDKALERHRDALREAPEWEKFIAADGQPALRRTKWAAALAALDEMGRTE